MARSGDATPREPTAAEKFSLGRQRARLEKAGKLLPEGKPEETPKTDK